MFVYCFCDIHEEAGELPEYIPRKHYRVLSHCLVRIEIFPLSSKAIYPVPKIVHDAELAIKECLASV